MSFDPTTLQHFETSEAAARYAADEVIKACQQAVTANGIFHWVLAGGGTPELSYRLLRDADLDWSKVHVWFGDERALPDGHSDRNETMARNALLDFIVIPSENIHNIDFSYGTSAAAEAYANEIGKIECFDLVMLGMGEDGHTASLFPNHESLKSSDLAVAEFHSPKAPPERVSMGFKALNNHKQCLILATGASKTDILIDIADGADLPITHIHNATWVADQAAFPK